MNKKEIIITLGIQFVVLFALIFAYSFFGRKNSTLLGSLCLATIVSGFMSGLYFLKDWDKNEVLPFARNWFEEKDKKE